MKKICFLIILTVLNFNILSFAQDYTDFDLSKTDMFLNLQKKPDTNLVVNSNLGLVENFDENFKFESSNEIVAKIQNNGKIIGVNEGATVITLIYKESIRQSIVIVVTELENGRAFFDSFENNDNKTDSQALTGTYSYDFTKAESYSMDPVGQMAVMWFYDDTITKAGTVAITDTPATFYYDVGADCNVSQNNYILKDTLRKKTTVTEVERKLGWHQVFLDLSHSGIQKLYLDGNLIFTDNQTSNKIYWLRMRKVVAANQMYGDDFATFNIGNKPVAYDLGILGDIEQGGTLVADYKFYHPRGQLEDGSIVEWFKNVDGTFQKVGDNKEYTIKEDEKNAIFKFEITPKTATFTGEKISSAIISKKASPIASNVKVEGVGAIGSVIMGKYDYMDFNQDLEKDSIYKWYRGDSLEGEFTLIENENSISYTIKENDDGKIIKFSVTPKSESEPFEGTTVMSENFVALVRPTAKNVTISGSGTVGQFIYGKYEYKHNLGIAEGVSKYRWLSNGVVLGTENSLQISSFMLGEDIVFEVTPCATVEPLMGKSVQSSSFYIKNNNNNGSVSIGGNTKPVVKPTTPKEQPIDENTKIEPKNFKDISGHWAEKEINWAVEKGYSKGMTEDAFMPDDTITKAQMATMLARVANIKSVDYNNAFADVSGDSWYGGYIQAMVDKKIIKNDDKEFKPEKNITREEMAVMLMETYSYLKNEKIQVNKKQFIADREMLQAWNEVYVDKALEIGLLKGMGNNYFKPLNISTRAQAVTVVKRLNDIAS